MSKPDDIPQDIWEAAYEALHPLVKEQYEISPFSQVQHYGIARAILAERERCAQVATDVTKAPYMRTSKDLWVQEIGGRIADAIRDPQA